MALVLLYKCVTEFDFGMRYFRWLRITIVLLLLLEISLPYNRKLYLYIFLYATFSWIFTNISRLVSSLPSKYSFVFYGICIDKWWHYLFIKKKLTISGLLEILFACIHFTILLLYIFYIEFSYFLIQQTGSNVASYRGPYFPVTLYI